MTKIYFKAPTPASGYPLQLVADLEKKTVKKGYCIASPFDDIIKLKNKKEIEKLFNSLTACGFSALDD